MPQVHSKLRNANAKGRAGRTSTSTTTSTTNTTSTATASGGATTSSSSNSGNNTCNNTPSTSPIEFLAPRAEKRKSKDDSPPPSFNGNENGNGNGGANSSSSHNVINPVTGLNVQIPKKVKTTNPSAVSPVLLECPEQDCSKKYKNPNGLKYHQSHAHGAGSMDEDSQNLPESPRAQPESPLTPQPFQTTNSQPSTPQPAGENSAAMRSRSPSPQPAAAADAQFPTATSIESHTATPNTPAVVASSMPSGAGGSITTGIAASAMQMQEQISMATDSSGALPLVASHSQSSTDGIVQTPTKADDRSKSKNIWIFLLGQRS